MSANLSLQKKTAARMAATQYLYQEAITKDAEPIASHVIALKKQLAGNASEQKLQVGLANEPNYSLLKTLASGVLEKRETINATLDSGLNENWKRERMSPLLIALLQCAIFEMVFYKETKPRIIVDEYTKIARSFFDEKEVNFVHGLLANIKGV